MYTDSYPAYQQQAENEEHRWHVERAASGDTRNSTHNQTGNSKMAFSGKATDGGGDFKNPTPGTVGGVLTRIVDLGTQEGGQYGPKRKVLLAFEIEEKMDNGEPFLVQSRFTLSFNKKAILLQTLESWRGRAYANDEMVELAPALGKPALLNLVESEYNGKTYVNIKAVSPLPKGMPPLTPAGKVIMFNLDEPDWDAFNDLSEYFQELIAKSPEYKEIMASPPKAGPDIGDGPSGDTLPPANPAPMPADFDDEIPF